ncbi:MAG TPA: ketose-bisphosphate aldolase [Thermopetrobacter sp.]|nr:ketose-bisphosphate aldolase [Thermopetrobacter sp.]
MPLVNMKDMLAHAHADGYAVAAFDLVGLDFLEAIMSAAEKTRAPVILSLAESHFDYFDFELAMAATVAAAKRASVPVAIHLDHGHTLQSAVRGIRFGCTGVMVDASAHPFEENVRLTKEVVDMAHGCGVPVEGELGYVPGVEGEDAERHPGEIAYTTPEEAERFVAATGVDFLAVSIGTVHGRMKGEPKLDFERLAAINERLNMPLVIHGGTGLSGEQFRRLIENGVTKINYYTALSDAAAAAIAANVNKGAKGYTAQVAGVREAIAAECARCIELWGSAGKAQEVLAAARPWREVEHVIIYNAQGISEEEADAMAAEGRRVLAAIPGVRYVMSGKAVQEDARYRRCWLARFVQPEVIDSFRDHPDHVRFADQRFRPVAGGRISIDYLLDE